MKLPQLAINNFQFIIILVILALFVGVNAYMTMPRSEDPNPNFPLYNVIVVYPGTSPEDMEELVIDPLEEVLDEIENITKINATIEEGVARIRLEAEYGIDVDEKYDEIRREVNTVRNELPDDIYSLDIFQVNPVKLVNIQQFALVSAENSYHNLLDIAEEFENEIEQIKGISNARIEAYPEEEVRISIDFQKMANQNIPIRQILGILQGNNANIPGGAVKAASKSFNIKSSGGFKDLVGLKNTVISANGDKIVYLKDIADVDFAYEDDRWKARYNGEKCLFISLTQERNVNIIRLSEKIDERVSSFRSRLPDNIQLVSAFEQAPAVKSRIHDFFTNLIQGVVLVGILVFIFLGYRPSIIVILVIPISIIIAIGALDAIGFTLQQISIAALVIALGLLVDNGIVVVENIVRFQREGHNWITAAYKGTAEVGYAVVSSTATTILAFFPLSMMQSGPGEYLKSLPVTVILVLIASLILALTFTPILASRFLKIDKKEKPRWIDKKLEQFIELVYRPALKFALRKPFIILSAALTIFIGSTLLFPSIGVSFFPTADKPLLLIEVETPEGSNIDRTNKATLYVEQVLGSINFVDNYITNIGHGNPMVYYNRAAKTYKKNFGQFLVNFKAWEPEKFYQTLSQLRKIFSKYPDAKITFSELKNGPPFEAPIEIKLLGTNLDTLKSLAGSVENIIANTEGAINIKNPLAISKTDLKIDINRDKAGLLQVPLIDIDRSVRASMTGLKIDNVSLNDGEEYPMIVRMPFDKNPDIEDFNKVYFTNRTGGQIPLRQIANVTFEKAVSKIQHYNLQRNTAVTADVIDADATKAITEKIIEQLEVLNLPRGYSYYVAGEYETQQESFGDLGKLLIIAMIGIFAVLVLQFRSFKQPLIVFSAIPLAITGSFIALFITGWSFSFFAFVGFISLVGIVVNNSIILVDYANQLIKNGASVKDALLKSCETRFTPIILTTGTTILGLLPLTLQQTQLWSPLGWTIIGGMISSTFLTLLIVPVLYQWFTKAETLHATSSHA